MKVESEKKTLERQVDFSTVAAFAVIDTQRHGYLDFENIRKFMARFKKDLKKSDINAIIRRMDLDADGKITFREFSHGITPEYPGVAQSVATIKNIDFRNNENLGQRKSVEFNVDKKQEIRHQYEERKQQTLLKDRSASPLRDYRNIYNATPVANP